MLFLFLLMVTMVVVVAIVAAVIMMIVMAVAVMTAIVMMFIPMVLVFRVAAVADDRLVATAPVLCISRAINVIVQIWSLIVDHHFVTAV
jgi:hypothetical protein